MKSISKYTLLIFLLNTPFAKNFGQVWTYDYADTLVYTKDLGRNFRSPKYQVKIIKDGKEFESYVMADYNTFPAHHQSRALMTDWNHFTTFSFQGQIQIEITVSGEEVLGECAVYPMVKNIPYEVLQNKLILRINEPQKMYIKIEGMEKEPLFIFADAPESDVPDRSEKSVGIIRQGMDISDVRKMLLNEEFQILVFEEGIHMYGEETNNSYPGYQMPVMSNKKIYIPGGAYVVGSFRGINVHNIKIYGRGIISGCGKERLAQAKSIPFNQIQLDGEGKDQHVEGMTFTNAPHFVLLSRGSIHAKNLKMFAWYHQTDGFGGGEGSCIENTFMKVNDDYVKIYKNHQKVEDMYFFKQINGALFQFGWGSYGTAHQVAVKDIYIMADADKYPQKTSNTAVINLVNNKGSDMGDCSFKNIYADENIQRLLGIRLNGGSMKNILIKNVRVEGKSNVFNYLLAEEGGHIDNVTLKDIYIQGEKIDSHEKFNLVIEGDVDNVMYE